MYATKCHNCLTWIKPISVLLVQGTIVHTDSSQSRSESLADVHPIRSWDGMNVGCLSLGSGNIREEEEEEKEKKQTKMSVSKATALHPAADSPPHWSFPQRLFAHLEKKTPLQINYSFTKREYSTC